MSRNHQPIYWGYAGNDASKHCRFQKLFQSFTAILAKQPNARRRSKETYSIPEMTDLNTTPTIILIESSKTNRPYAIQILQ
jgi:hypothetical protein